MHFSTKQTWNFNEVKWIATFVEFIVILLYVRKPSRKYWILLLKNSHATTHFPLKGKMMPWLSWSWNAFLLNVKQNLQRPECNCIIAIPFYANPVNYRTSRALPQLAMGSAQLIETKYMIINTMVFCLQDLCVRCWSSITLHVGSLTLDFDGPCDIYCWLSIFWYSIWSMTSVLT